MDGAASPPDHGVARRVRRYRDAKGWTQAQLATRCGLAPATISRVERGLERPAGRTVAALAEALGVEASRLLGLEGQPELFPAPDSLRLALVRRIMELPDERIEDAHAALGRALDAADERAMKRSSRRRRGEP